MPAAQAAAAPAPCLSRYLGAKAGISQGGLGSTYVAIVFKNLNNSPCSLYGYPGISLAGGKPVTQIGQAAIEDPATPRTLVTLAPGGVANALLRIVAAGNYPAAKCGPVTAHWLQMAAEGTLCQLPDTAKARAAARAFASPLPPTAWPAVSCQAGMGW